MPTQKNQFQEIKTKNEKEDLNEGLLGMTDKKSIKVHKSELGRAEE